MHHLTPPSNVIAAWFPGDSTIKPVPFGDGHINSTFFFKSQGGEFIIQKINKNVFHHPDEVMHNISRVSEFLEKKDYAYKILKPLPTKQGQYFFIADEEYWRVFPFIAHTRAVSRVETVQQAKEGARAFGQFAHALKDLSTENIYYTIPVFHNYQKRYEDFIEAVDKDAAGRLPDLLAEVDRMKELYPLIGDVLSVIAPIPRRVIHSDTKISNVLIDEKTNQGVSVIDLDTLMPGYLFYDYSDMVRSFTNTADEDEKDIDQVKMSWDIFEALTRGYLETLGPSLSDAEWLSLEKGVAVVTYIQVLRFLADYLNGDIYYKIDYPDHNLNRTRNQIKLLESILGYKQQINELLKEIRSSGS
ncbi:MAG: aminoglycoside phosphotransferase family protein [Cyclobacteriaceae bacterium]|nr:aminoglycoside phosphotransferase family protein [Cyclobacteriaceae bacterium]